MKKLFFLMIGLVFAVSLAAHFSNASFLTFRNTYETKVMGDTSSITIKIENLGDEPSYNVYHELFYNGTLLGKTEKHFILPNNKYEWEINVPYKDHYIIRTNYMDQNQYPYSILNVIIVNNKKEDENINIGNSELAREGKTYVECNGYVNLYSPKEIGLDWNNGKIEGKKEIHMKDKGMLVGNANTIIAECFHDGKYSIGKGNIKRIENKELKNFSIKASIFLIILIGIILFYSYKRIKRHEMIVFIIMYIFMITYFTPSVMLTKTITTGGDTASHYYTLDFMAKNISSFFPGLSSWTMGNYAGFPILQFYFGLPFLLMYIISFFTGLEISFKLISVLGVFLLPATIYYFARKLKAKNPIYASIFSLAFLFNEGNSMWGGNILSTLAGEFSYSISFALIWLYFGKLYEIMNKKRVGKKDYAVAISFLFLTGMCHVYGLLLSVVVTIAYMVLKKEYVKSTSILGIGGLLLSFFYLPLYTTIKYTTAYADFWHVKLSSVFPQIMWPFIAITLFMVGVEWKKANRFLIVIIISSLFMYLIALYIGVVNIRFIPFMQLMLVATGGMYIKKVSGWKNIAMIFVVLLLTLGFVFQNSSKAKHWIKWNYEGFEEKNKYELFNSINKELDKGGFNEGRVVFEHNSKHNMFGTIRAFESLPLFAHRATPEGLYMQSSLNAPFIFYMQSLYSVQNSCPFPNFGCSKTNLTRAIPYFNLYNINQEIVATDEIKEGMDKLNEYKLDKEFENGYYIYNISIDEGYVKVPKYKPIHIKSNYNQKKSFLWFINESNLDAPLVFYKGNIDSDYIADNASESIDINCNISNVNISNNRIEFNTDCVGVPHILKISYFPYWHSRQGKIYHVSPSFMMIIPNNNHVVITYSKDIFSWMGFLLFIVGLLLVWKIKYVIKFVKRIRKIIPYGIIAFVLLVIVFILIKHTDPLQKDVAIATKSYRACDYAGKYRDECLIEVGKETHDYNLCLVEVSKNVRDECLLEVGKVWFDYNLCIAEVEKDKDGCLYEVAKYNHNITPCGYIKDKSIREKCENIK